MWKFFQSGHQSRHHHTGQSDIRLTPIRDALDLTPTSKVGFPHKPTALGYDSHFSLIAVGTGSGEVFVYGSPGVEFYCNHYKDTNGITSLTAKKTIHKIFFLPPIESTNLEIESKSREKPRFLTLCEDDSLHLWLLETSKEGKPKTKRLKLATIDASKYRKREMNEANSDRRLCTSAFAYLNCGVILLGTESGYILEFNMQEFTVLQAIASVDIASQCTEFRGNPGSTEIISHHPRHEDLLLIGYSRGLVVIYDWRQHKIINYATTNHELEYACWCTLNGNYPSAQADATSFITTHSDGSYQIWDWLPDRASSAAAATAPTDKIYFKLTSRESHTPYGPFPCKAINKVQWCGTSGGYSASLQSALFFSGGMPRAAYGDHHTVSVVRDAGTGMQDHVCFDCTSKVIDFLPITIRSRANTCSLKSNSPSGNKPGSFFSRGFSKITTTQTHEMYLILLLEEELVILDVSGCRRWRELSNPYLVSLHSSAITCFQLYDNVSNKVWKTLENAHHDLAHRRHSPRMAPEPDWPIFGGEPMSRRDRKKFLLVTGHEDGTVKFWDVGGYALRLLIKLNTASLFVEGEDFSQELCTSGAEQNSSGADSACTPDMEDEEAEEEWPPFRKIGKFDPYSDDPRFSVQRLTFSSANGSLAVAGTAGQVIVFNITENDDITHINLDSISVHTSLVGDKDGFKWKGHRELKLRTRSPIVQPPYVRVSCALQISPPAACSALALEANWGLFAAGTAHGVTIVDYRRKSGVLAHCTLTSIATDLATGSDTVMSRRKSFKKSLRESFRRIRRGRASLRAANAIAANAQRNSHDPRAGGMGSLRASMKHSRLLAEVESRPPMERSVETRAHVVKTDEDGGLSSVVRTLKFSYANILNSHVLLPTLWVGTNFGTISIFSLLLPQEKEKKQKVTAALCKEIQLRHHAPVINIEIIEASTGRPLDDILRKQSKRIDVPSLMLPSDVHRTQVIVVSEEQLKAFTLPHLKTHGSKYKLTASEGALVRRIEMCQIPMVLKSSETDAIDLSPASQYSAGSKDGSTVKVNAYQWCLVALTNLGDVRAYSIPGFHTVVNWSLIARDDLVAISGINLIRGSAIGIYQCASSQFQRLTLSKNAPRFGIVRCSLAQSDSSGASTPVQENLHNRRNSIDDDNTNVSNASSCETLTNSNEVANNAEERASSGGAEPMRRASNRETYIS